MRPAPMLRQPILHGGGRDRRWLRRGVFGAVFVGILGLSAAASAASQQPPRQASVSEFPIELAPAPADWRTFIKASEGAREKLWQYQVGRGKHLKNWSWGWRLGWVRVCGQSERPYCQTVLREALFDKALVVRAEAATRFGELYAGTAAKPIVQLLGQAFRLSGNSRHGKPLFVQKRILFALHQIGGDDATQLGRMLADARSGTQTYWLRLEHEGAAR